MIGSRQSVLAHAVLAVALFGALALSLQLDPVIAALPDAAASSELKVVGSWLWDEDGVVEAATAVLAFAAGVGWCFAIIRGRRLGMLPLGRHLVVPILVSIAMFTLAGEEISWGQRVLGLATPSVLSDVNAQNELTIHNLDLIVSPIVVLKGAAFAWGLVVPVACLLVGVIARLVWLVRLPVPPLACASLFIGALAFPLVLKTSYGNFAREGQEFLLAASFVVVAFDAWRRPTSVWVDPTWDGRAMSPVMSFGPRD